MKRFFVHMLCFFAPAIASAQTLVITQTTVYEEPGKKRDNVSVLVRDGKIVSVGELAVPAGAQVIDGRGKLVTAGFVEAHTQLGLVTVDLEPAASDGRFDAAEDDVHAAYRAIDGYDARAITIPVARQGGVTSAVSSPAGALFAGQSAWFPLLDAETPPEAVRAPTAMHASLGASATASGSRGIAVERLREVLSDAQTYGKNRAAYEKNQQRRYSAERLDLEALQPVLRGEIPLVVRADAEGDLRAALAVAREFKLRLVIAGGAESHRVAKELAQAKVPVILDPTRNLPLDLAAVDVRDDTATVLAAAGVQVAISTLGDASQARNIRQLAGIAVSHGLAWDAALAALTTVPAAIYGVKDRGAVRAGFVADLVVWSGDPLELSSRAEQVIVNGKVQGTRSHQTRLLERYRAR